jgi:hypothetical protein
MTKSGNFAIRDGCLAVRNQRFDRVQKFANAEHKLEQA